MLAKSLDQPHPADRPATVLPFRGAWWCAWCLAFTTFLVTAGRVLAQGEVQSIPSAAGFTRNELLLGGTLAVVLLTLPIALIWTQRRIVYARTLALSDAFVEQKR